MTKGGTVAKVWWAVVKYKRGKGYRTATIRAPTKKKLDDELKKFKGNYKLVKRGAHSIAMWSWKKW